MLRLPVFDARSPRPRRRLKRISYILARLREKAYMGTRSREERRENQKLGGVRNFVISLYRLRLKTFYSYSPRDRTIICPLRLFARAIDDNEDRRIDGSSLRITSSVLFYRTDRESRRSGNAHAISSNADDLGRHDPPALRGDRRVHVTRIGTNFPRRRVSLCPRSPGPKPRSSEIS